MLRESTCVHVMSAINVHIMLYRIYSLRFHDVKGWDFCQDAARK